MLTLAPHPTNLMPLPKGTTFSLDWEAVQFNAGPFASLVHHVFERVDGEGLIADLFPARPSPQATRIVHLTPLAFFHPAADKAFPNPRPSTLPYASNAGNFQAARIPRDPTDTRLLPALRVGNRYKPLPWLLRYRGPGYRGLEDALTGKPLAILAEGIGSYPRVARTLDDAQAGMPVLPALTQGLSKGADGAARRLLQGLGQAAVRASARHVGVPITAVRQVVVSSALPRFIAPSAWSPSEAVGQPTVRVRLFGTGGREGKTAEEKLAHTLQTLLMMPTFRGDPLRWLEHDHKGEAVTVAALEASDIQAARSSHAVLLEETMLRTLSQPPGQAGCV